MDGDAPQLLELKQISDDFATGCGKVEIVGSCARFYFYADQQCLGSGDQERVLVAKLVMPIDAVSAALHVMTIGVTTGSPQNILAREMLLKAGRTGH